MTTPLYRPTTDLVAQAWLRLALPGVGVGDALPAADVALRTVGFVRTTTIGGNPGRYVPMREPVVAAECWVAPPDSQVTPWTRAGQLAERVVAASYDPALMGVLLDLSSVGSYGPARVHTVTAVAEPRRIEDDPSHFARFDVDLAFLWSTA